MIDSQIEIPCFCGSGKKFKDCCIEVLKKEGLGLSIEVLSRIKSMDDFIRYTMPLFRIFGGTKQGVEFSIKLANASWCIAEMDEEDRHQTFNLLIKDFSRSIGLRPEDENLLFRMVNDMIKRYHKMFQGKKDISKSEPDETHDEGWESYEEGKYKMAMDYFKNALRQNPEYINALHGFGPVAFEQNWLNNPKKI